MADLRAGRLGEIIAAGLGVKKANNQPFMPIDFLTRRVSSSERDPDQTRHAPGDVPTARPTQQVPWEIQYGNVVMLNHFAGGHDLRKYRRELIEEGMTSDEALVEVLKRQRDGMYDQPADVIELPRERLNSV